MPIIEITQLKTKLGGQWVHNGLDLQVDRKEILGIVGGSGSGKTTLLRSILMLQRPTSGSIKVFDTDVTRAKVAQARSVRQRWGVLFQQNALFSSLTVLENVCFPLRTFTKLPSAIQEQIALLKIALAGLPLSTASKYPAELSGGMQKRAALARAIALDPELLFLDEPTAGLDPQSAESLDDLVLHLRKNLGLTVVVITHDLDTIERVTDRVAFLGEGKVLAALPLAQLMEQQHPLIKAYFSGPRGARHGH
jgi:phospholipid/cholesterol/gamma-HCH transport system ATP-binding protein